MKNRMAFSGDSASVIQDNGAPLDPEMMIQNCIDLLQKTSRRGPKVPGIQENIVR
jgi:hypothetical protein